MKDKHIINTQNKDDNNKIIDNKDNNIVYGVHAVLALWGLAADDRTPWHC